MAGIIALRLDIDHQGGIGIALIARILAHAIGYKASRLGRSRHHCAAGAHAKAIGGAAIATGMAEAIIGSTQRLKTCKVAKSRPIDQRLRVFDPHTDRKWLGLEIDALGVQPSKHVPGAMAHRQNHLIRRDPRAVLGQNRRHATTATRLAKFKSSDLGLKAIFPAQRLNRRPHPLHHTHQPKGANVGVGFGENFRWGTRNDELLQDFPAKMARVLDLAIELAVRKGSSAAFAELHIRFGIELGATPKAPGVFGPLTDRLAAI